MCSSAGTTTPDVGVVACVQQKQHANLALVEELDTPSGRGLANCDKMSAGPREAGGHAASTAGMRSCTGRWGCWREREIEGEVGDTTDLVDEKSNEGAVLACQACGHSHTTRTPRHSVPERALWGHGRQQGHPGRHTAPGPPARQRPAVPRCLPAKAPKRPALRRRRQSQSRTPIYPPIKSTPRKGAQPGETGRRRPKRNASSPSAPPPPPPRTTGPATHPPRSPAKKLDT